MTRAKKLCTGSYAASVQIWADTGEPMGVIFGNGWGRNFLSRSYRDWLQDGVKEEDITPYVQTVIYTNSSLSIDSVGREEDMPCQQNSK